MKIESIHDHSMFKLIGYRITPECLDEELILDRNEWSVSKKHHGLFLTIQESFTTRSSAKTPTAGTAENSDSSEV